MNTKRSYTMTARAEAVEETRRAILEATYDLHAERFQSDINLEAVAQRAGVSVQTVLRQFGSRAQLFGAALEFARDVVIAERRAPVGDVSAAVRAIVDHYELRGTAVLLMLAQELGDADIKAVTDGGKRLHREWVEEVFAPFMAELGAGDRDAVVDLLGVATDVFTWKLLRRDRGLSRQQTERRIHDLVTAVLAATPQSQGRRN